MCVAIFVKIGSIPTKKGTKKKARQRAAVMFGSGLKWCSFN